MKDKYMHSMEARLEEALIEKKLLRDKIAALKAKERRKTAQNNAMNAIAWANDEKKHLLSKKSLTQFEEGTLYAVKAVCGLGAKAS